MTSLEEVLEAREEVADALEAWQKESARTSVTHMVGRVPVAELIAADRERNRQLKSFRTRLDKARKLAGDLQVKRSNEGNSDVYHDRYAEMLGLRPRPDPDPDPDPDKAGTPRREG